MDFSSAESECDRRPFFSTPAWIGLSFLLRPGNFLKQVCISIHKSGHRYSVRRLRLRGGQRLRLFVCSDSMEFNYRASAYFYPAPHVPEWAHLRPTI